MSGQAMAVGEADFVIQAQNNGTVDLHVKIAGKTVFGANFDIDQAFLVADNIKKCAEQALTNKEKKGTL